MDLSLTEEQKMTRDMVTGFAKKEVAPRASELDSEERFPSELVVRMAELGLMGMIVPVEYGGAGAEMVSYVIAVEELARACASTAVIMSVNNSLVCDPILKYGTQEQKRRYLPALATGAALGSFALTEPGFGSDAASISMTARQDGEFWVLNGRKLFVTNGPSASFCLTFATMNRDLGPRGICAFVVEKGTEGYSVGTKEHKLGIRASETSELLFDDCRVPASNLLGKPGDGLRVALSTLDGGRIGIAAQAIGIARAALEESIAYSKQRVQFDRPICEFQAIQWMLADMATEIEAARSLTVRAAWLKDSGQPHTKEAAMAKLFASDVAVQASRKAIQVLGGYGYTKDYPVERYFRDAKVTELYEGTSEIMRLVISRALLR